MKITNRCFLGLACGCLCLAGGAAQGDPIGTAFVYQGQLATGTNATAGSYDLTFALFDAPASGS